MCKIHFQQTLLIESDGEDLSDCEKKPTQFVFIDVVLRGQVA